MGEIPLMQRIRETEIAYRCLGEKDLPALLKEIGTAMREKDAEIERLRVWIRGAADVLSDHEWAEQLPVDGDLQYLEAQISDLIGRNGYVHIPNDDLQDDLDALTQAVNKCGIDVAWECGSEPGVRVKNILGLENLARAERAEAQRDALLVVAKNYYMRYCQDEADDEGCEITGCSYQQHLDARALLNAIRQIEQENGA